MILSKERVKLKPMTEDSYLNDAISIVAQKNPACLSGVFYLFRIFD